jgi:GWxTD domain-containing protein
VSWLTLLAVAQSAAAMQGRPEPSELRVGAARFYRGDRTLVNGYVRVPHELLNAVAVGQGGFAAFRFEVGVVDQTGMTLVRDSWMRRVPWSAWRVRGSATVELLTFALAPGAYEIRVGVTDSATGREATGRIPVSAFEAGPASSDLLLAHRIRRAESGDTAAGPGELHKGDLLITTGPDLVLTPAQALLYYYCEVYRDSAGSVPWLLHVVTADGRTAISTSPAESQVAAGGGTVTGSVNLTGLPPGTYRLALVMGAGADTVSRSAEFRMAGFELEQQLVEATRTTGELEDVFARSSEAQLDTLFAPLVYLAERGELTPYDGLTAEGKQRFLRGFWRRRDPTPGTPENEMRAGFYLRIAEANRRFREGGAARIPGWRTDRGRILILHGEPEQTLRRPSSGPTNPWEAWKYTRQRAVRYVFYDQTRLGNYILLFTNDLKERSYPNWDSILGVEAVQEIERF